MVVAIRTICCKLTPTQEQVDEIDATMVAFANACNYIASRAAEADIKGQFAIHRLVYNEVRFLFALSANLTVRAIARVSSAKEISLFEPTSVDYDARIFAFHEADFTFGVTLLSGRVRLTSCLGDFQRDTLKGKKPTSATLVKRDGEYYLHVQIKEDVPETIEPSEFLGVDLGIANIAVDSEGEFFSGEKVERQRKRRATARKQYQRKGAKSAKRRLKKLSGRQARYQRHVNHEISKRLVEKAKTQASGIALENLSNLRERCEATASKKFRRRLGNWGFHQLRQFVEYKAKAAGVRVVLVNPRNTSRTCSECGHCEKANRPSQAVFCCTQCNFSMNADENAARNISALGLNCKAAPKVATSACSIKD